MDSSREQSPDWLRSFQAPIHSVLTLSSDSESSPNDSPLREDRLNSKEPAPEETSQFPEKGEDHDVSRRGRGKDSLPNKTLKAKSPIKRPKARDTPVKKKRKTDNISGSGGCYSYVAGTRMQNALNSQFVPPLIVSIDVSL
ncbi:hypothetical protein U1Q18_004862 [Sarracenia purpurea var. burkii]